MFGTCGSYSIIIFPFQILAKEEAWGAVRSFTEVIWGGWWARAWAWFTGLSMVFFCISIFIKVRIPFYFASYAVNLWKECAVVSCILDFEFSSDFLKLAVSFMHLTFLFAERLYFDMRYLIWLVTMAHCSSQVKESYHFFCRSLWYPLAFW